LEKYLSLSDNYVDVIPGENCEIKLLVQELKFIKKGLKFRSYLQVYDKDELEIVYL